MKKPQSIPAKILNMLDTSNFNYKVLTHRTVFTAYDAAATLKRELKHIAKALIVMAGNFPVIVLMPAHARLDEKKISKILKDSFNTKVNAKIPKEKVAQKIIKDAKRPVSAFGSLYKLPVIIDKGLITNHLIVFPAASFNNSIEMMVKDFVKLEKAVVGSFAQANKIKPQKVQKNKKQKTKKATVKKTSKKKVVKKNKTSVGRKQRK